MGVLCPTQPISNVYPALSDAHADAHGESASARAPKRKRTAVEDDTKRNESAAKRPARPQRPAAAAASSAVGTSASASAPVQRPPAPKKPPMQNGNANGAANTGGRVNGHGMPTRGREESWSSSMTVTLSSLNGMMRGVGGTAEGMSGGNCC